MSVFLKSSNQIRVSATKPDFTCYDKLPAATYAVKVDEGGFFLEEITNFKLPPKLYGECTKHRDRIINSFEDRPYGTGAFLEGEKGSGKTLLAKAISIACLQKGMPTLVVNSPLAGEQFNTFVQSINQPCVMVFDEFEKVYDKDTQPRILTLFDGVYPTKKLFIVTCNDSWRIDEHFKNRPGRLYYLLKFDGLSQNFIREYAEDNLKNKDNIENLLVCTSLFTKFNFDMLQATVEEMNRYGETAKEAMRILNTVPASGEAQFDISLIVGGKVIKNDDDMAITDVWHGDPLDDEIYVDTYQKNPEAKRILGGQNRNRYIFEPEHLVKLEGGIGRFTFQKDDITLVLTKKQKKKPDYSHFMM